MSGTRSDGDPCSISEYDGDLLVLKHIDPAEPGRSAMPAQPASDGSKLDPQNAQLLAQASQRQRWLEASRDIATMLLAGAAPADVFPLLLACVRDLADADSAFLALPIADGQVRVEVADGWGAEGIRGLILPAQSMSARVMGEAHAVAVTDARHDRRIWQTVIAAADAGPAIFVPLGTEDSTVGTLVVTNRQAGASFNDETISVIEFIAAQAAIALRLGAAAKDREQLALVGDRDRIARDLHDLVIQRLFAIGISLQSIVPDSKPDAVATRVQVAVDDLDATIKEIRTTIFALHAPTLFAGQGLRERIREVADAASVTLGFGPMLRLDGPLDLLVPTSVAEHLLAVLREGLSNVAHHARAKTVVISVVATAEDVTLCVVDDGIGIDRNSDRSGLLNLAHRARILGGRFDARTIDDGPGSLIEWSVPLTPGSRDQSS